MGCLVFVQVCIDCEYMSLYLQPDIDPGTLYAILRQNAGMLAEVRWQHERSSFECMF